MRNLFLLKLSLRILDQLNVLIFVLPYKKMFSNILVLKKKTTQLRSINTINHLKNLKAHIGNSEVDLGAFTVCCWVETDTIQFQFTSNLQNLKIRFSWSLTPATDDINVYIRLYVYIIHVKKNSRHAALFLRSKKKQKKKQYFYKYKMAHHPTY